MYTFFRKVFFVATCFLLHRNFCCTVFFCTAVLSPPRRREKCTAKHLHGAWRAWHAPDLRPASPVITIEKYRAFRARLGFLQLSQMLLHARLGCLQQSQKLMHARLGVCNNPKSCCTQCWGVCNSPTSCCRQGCRQTASRARHAGVELERLARRSTIGRQLNWRKKEAIADPREEGLLLSLFQSRYLKMLRKLANREPDVGILYYVTITITITITIISTSTSTSPSPRY